MVNAKLISEITATELKSAAYGLLDKDCGCFHKEVYHDKKHGLTYSICLGWHMTDDPITRRWISRNEPGWALATKIGRQTDNNIMQCDLDIDFEMPYDATTGYVDDTCEDIDDPKCYFSNEDDYWEWLAEHLNKEAVRVVQSWC